MEPPPEDLGTASDAVSVLEKSVAEAKRLQSPSGPVLDTLIQQLSILKQRLAEAKASQTTPKEDKQELTDETPVATKTMTKAAMAQLESAASAKAVLKLKIDARANQLAVITQELSTLRQRLATKQSQSAPEGDPPNVTQESPPSSQAPKRRLSERSTPSKSAKKEVRFSDSNSDTASSVRAPRTVPML